MWDKFDSSRNPAPLNAKLHQGFDPNTEHQEKSNLFSASPVKPNSASFFDQIKNFVSSIEDSFKSVLPSQQNAAASSARSDNGQSAAAPNLLTGNGGAGNAASHESGHPEFNAAADNSSLGSFAASNGASPFGLKGADMNLMMPSSVAFAAPDPQPHATSGGGKSDPSQSDNPGGGSDPGNGGNPGGGSDPGNGGNPGGGSDPGNGGNPGGGSDPGNGSNPGGGSDPGNGGNPGGGSDPGNGGNPGGGSDPGNGGNPGGGSDPGNGGNPGGGSDPGNGGNPGGGNDPGNGGTTITVQAPIITVPTQPSHGDENHTIALNISVATDPQTGVTTQVTIGGVPTDGLLSAGINNHDGTWTLTVQELAGLTFSLPEYASGEADLTVTAISTKDGVTASADGHLVAVIDGIATTPTLSVQAASGVEEQAIPLTIHAGLVDTDGSETLMIQIANVPVNATLSAGDNQGNGVWILTVDDLAHLTLTTPANWSGNLTLHVSAIAAENTTTATVQADLPVHVDSTIDSPLLVVQGAIGIEDVPIALSIGASLPVVHAGDTLSVTIAGVPLDATLSAGVNQGNGVWVLTTAELNGLTLNPPEHYSGALDLTVTATAMENGIAVSVSDDLHVAITGVAIAPTLAVTAAVGLEDTAIALTIDTHLVDIDGSEQLSVVIGNVPVGATLSAGTSIGDGKYVLSASDLTNLHLTPPANYNGTIDLSVSAIATENNGDTAAVNATCHITILPVADAPLLSVNAAVGLEDHAIALPITAVLPDLSETLTVTISGVPVGATLSAGINNGDGSWSLVGAQLNGLTIHPPANSDADFTLTVQATSTALNGDAASTTLTLPVSVVAVADIPTISTSNSIGAQNTAIALHVNAAVTDTDGSETVSVVIHGVPDGFALNHGTNNGDNSWTVTAAQLAGLSLTTPHDFEGRVYLTANAVAHDHDNSIALSASSAFEVDIGNAAGGTQINLGLGIGVAGIGVGTGIGLNTGGLLQSGGLVVMEDSTVNLTDAPQLLTLAAGISYITLSGLPTGASLSAGVNLGGGEWKLTSAQLTGLHLNLPTNSDADFTITAQAKLLGAATVTLATTEVHVIGVADLPTLHVNAAIGVEGSAGIVIPAIAALTDLDGSETLSITLKDLPAGFIPNVGIHNGDGSWSIAADQLSSLTVKPPEHFSGDITYTLVATATEREGDSSQVSVTGHLHVEAVADAPVIGVEGHAANLNLNVALADTDGSESLGAVTISGLPVGATLSHATDNHNGTWSVAASDIGQVQFIPAAHWSGDATLSISASSTESSNGSSAAAHTNLGVHIDARADTPVLTTQNESGSVNHAIDLHLAAATPDTDGSEHFSVVIAGIPDGSLLSAGLNNHNGSWTVQSSDLAHLAITPPSNFSGDLHLSATAYSQETSNHDVAVSVAQNFTVHVDAPMTMALHALSLNSASDASAHSWLHTGASAHDVAHVSAGAHVGASADALAVHEAAAVHTGGDFDHAFHAHTG